MTNEREQIEESLFRALLNSLPNATQKQLLERYAKEAPQAFVQYDGWPDMPPDVDMPPDEDGDALTSSHTVELMRGAGVRVLIDPATAPTDAARILRKIACCVKRYPDERWMNAREEAVDNAKRLAHVLPVEVVQLLTRPGSEAALRELARLRSDRDTEKAPPGPRLDANGFDADGYYHWNRPHYVGSDAEDPFGQEIG